MATGWMVIDVGEDPVVGAHVDDGVQLERYAGADDWRQALAWMRARTDVAYCRLEGDGFSYWVGRGPSPNPARHPPLPDSVLGHVDHAIDQVRRLRARHRAAIAPAQRIAAAGGRSLMELPGPGPWVRPEQVEASSALHPGLADGLLVLDCEDPHVIAGWWAAATGYVRTHHRGSVTALRPDPGQAAMAFGRGTPTGPVRVSLMADDPEALAARLVDLGGTDVTPSPVTRSVADPEGAIADLIARS